MSSRDWMNEAKCRTEDPRLFFPESPGVHGKREAERAARICMGCPVRRECSEYQQETKSEYGVWAGKAYDSPYARGVSAGGPRPHRRAS